MKKVLCALTAILIVGHACKKSDSIDTPVVQNPISPDSAQLLSDTLKVVHYKTITKAVLPTSMGNAIVLKDKKDTVIAVNGGYAIIIPEFETGVANGYYVQVKGANTYFTIDLNQPMYRKKAPVKNGPAERSSSDSIIAIRLPGNILPGIFTVQYKAYDSLNNVSNVASSIVKVMTNDPAATEFKLLQGKWNIRKYITKSGMDSTETMLNYNLDSSFANYGCDENNLLYNEEVGTSYLNWQGKTNESSYSFFSNNHFYTHDVFFYKSLNLYTSRCGTPVYDKYDFDYYSLGSYYYNTVNKQLIIIYDRAGAGDEEYYTEAFTLTNITDKNLQIVRRINAEVTEAIVLIR